MDLRIRPTTSLQTIDPLSAERLGLRPRTFVDPDTGQTVSVVSVGDVWAEASAGEGWTASYRFVVKDDRIQIGEIRLVPQEDNSDGRDPGTWSGTWRGVDAAPPITPLLSRHVHQLRAVPHVQHLRELAQAATEIRRRTGGSDVVETSGGSAELGRVRRAVNVDSDEVRPLGEQPSVGTPLDVTKRDDEHRTPRGPRPKHTPKQLAEIARRYVGAVDKGIPAIRAIARAYRIKVATARGLVARVRKAGMLVGSHGGRQGGALSDEAIRLLRTPKNRWAKRSTKHQVLRVDGKTGSQ